MNERELAERLFGRMAERVRDIPRELGAEVKQQIAHGAHELAAALFSPGNTAFVMYPRQQGKNDHGIHGPDHGLDHRGQERDQQLERGGRSM